MDHRGAIDKEAGDRLDWVDVARGIGILAVVVGHVWTRGPLRDALYSFHMPLFFILSGMLSRPQPVGRFTLRQLTSQMRPYAIFLTLLIVADQMIEPLKGGRPIFHQWPGDLLPILLGGFWLRGPYTIFWFVPCLMVARILFNIALCRWPDPFDRRWPLLLVPVTGAAYALGWMMQASPLGLLAVPMAFVLLWIGAAWARVGWRNVMIVPLALLSLAGLAGWFPTLNMKVADYGWPLLSIGSAIATSLLIVAIARRVACFAPLASLGRASLVIMYLHVAFIHYLSPYMGKMWLLAIALIVPYLLWRVIGACPPAKRILL
ncbi:acyltransferase family protein [Sphingobium sp. AS12]|uniref:acyltransferase family protein n=1 Tax=Sphingobium sp. AS12 TaxID=2849495 RepID=UPI001C3197C7|nr:acyltransferase family protein [Sphingobium sp. AS12]MBV2150535.1 acyltransferase family protein [Sphingobium sp. AS12]